MSDSSLTLIVDDEPDIRELLELTLGRMGIDTKAAPNLTEAKQLLSNYTFDMCLTDMKLPDGDGLDQRHGVVAIAVRWQRDRPAAHCDPRSSAEL